MQTYIMPSPLSLLRFSSAHVPPYTHKFMSAVIQSLSAMEGTDAPSGSGGGHAHCVCVQWDVLGTNTFLQSQTRQSPSVGNCRKSAFRIPGGS